MNCIMQCFEIEDQEDRAVTADILALINDAIVCTQTRLLDWHAIGYEGCGLTLSAYDRIYDALENTLHRLHGSAGIYRRQLGHTA